jgi:multiple sugar transport system permease protein
MSKNIPNKEDQTLIGLLFTSPWIIGFVLFFTYPIFSSLYYSFCHFDIFRPAQWIGIQNYNELLTSDPYFWKSTGNTLIYTVLRVPLNIIGSLLLAMMVNRSLRGITVFRTLYFFPSLVAGVSISVIWMWMFNPQYGLINSFLRRIGIEGPLWLGSAAWSKPSLVLMTLWGIGGGRMILYLAALQGVPRGLYESAEVDGATWWTKFRHITIPMISPVLFLTIIFEVIGSFQVFTEAYVMTNGGPLNSTLFYNLYLYFKAFVDFDMGYACAMAWILCIVMLAFTLFQFRLSRRWVFYAGKK